jgi:hypothetical protein
MSPVLKVAVDVGGPDEGCKDEEEVEGEEEGSAGGLASWGSETGTEQEQGRNGHTKYTIH